MGLGGLRIKGGIPFFSLFFPFPKYGDLTRIFSQENIFKKSMSYSGGTKHGKNSTQKFKLKKFKTN
jgi:hypothetical protein